MTFGTIFQRPGCERAEAVHAARQGLAPATQRDMLIHIQSLRHDVNFTLAQAALAAFGNAIKIEEETHGFRWVEERDLSGFIDGTENPQGEQRPAVATIAEGEEDAGGSYVLVQRYEHNLRQWQRFTTEQQEQIIGRTKRDSEELPADQRPDTSHVSRVDLKRTARPENSAPEPALWHRQRQAWSVLHRLLRTPAQYRAAAAEHVRRSGRQTRRDAAFQPCGYRQLLLCAIADAPAVTVTPLPKPARPASARFPSRKRLAFLPYSV